MEIQLVVKEDISVKTHLMICKGSEEIDGDVLIFPEMIKYRGQMGAPVEEPEKVDEPIISNGNDLNITEKAPPQEVITTEEKKEDVVSCCQGDNDLSIIEKAPSPFDDIEGLDASVAHIANLLSTEPADVKLGIGGFSMGAATALYSATCFTQGKYGNGNSYPINLRAIVGLSGWLPGSRSLRNKIEGSNEAARRAASLPILLCHGV